MVLAFNSEYNKETNTQRDMILKQVKDGFVLQRRINLQPFTEKEFEKEEEAYQAFEEGDL